MGTTSRGYRYPESTDLVKDGAQAIEDLATDVDGDVGTLLTDCVWTTYTPTWSSTGTAPTFAGDASFVGKYVVIGNTVHVRAYYYTGTSSGTKGTGTYTFGLPVQHAATTPAPSGLAGVPLGSALYYIGTGEGPPNNLPGIGFLRSDYVTAVLLINDDSGTGGGLSASNDPATDWANGAYLYLQFTYEKDAAA